MAKTATRQVSIFMNGKEVENSIKAIGAEQKKANAELARMIIGTDEYVKKAADVQRLNGILAEHRQALNGIKKGVDLNRSGLDKFVGLAAGAFTVDAVLGFGKQLFNTGLQLESMAKKAKTVFGEALPQVTAEAEKNARAMGLTNAQYITAAANIQDLLVPMGFQRQEAASISTQLVNLSGALAEWSGGTRTAAEVSEILNKALLGEREELKSLGIAISEADVKNALAAKGMDKLTGAALEQAKATTTLELILAKSTDAQAQFADGAGSMARRQAEATAKFQEVAEKLATALLPVFERLLSLADGVANFFSDMANGLESIVEPAKSASNAFDDQALKVKSLEENIVPLLSRYEDLTSKSNLSKKEQDELRKIIDTVASAVPGAVTEFDKYGKALGLNTSAAREFIEVEKSRLQFVNSNAIKANQDILKQTEEQASSQQRVIQGMQNALKQFSETATNDAKAALSQQIGQRAQDLANLQNTIKGINAEISRLTGDNLKTPPAATVPPTTPDGGGGGTDKRVKEEEKTQKELLALIERTTEMRKDLLSKQTVDEVAIAIRGVEKRYDAEISKAIELEAKGVQEATAQRIILEQLKQDELSLVTDKFYASEYDKLVKSEKDKQDAELKAYQETLDFLDEKYAERAEFELEIKEFERAGLLTDRDNELLELEAHYQTLLDYATKNGFDTVALTKSFEAQKTELAKEGSKERENVELQVLENYAALQIDRANAVAQGAAILSGFFEETSAVGKAFFLVEKAAAAVSVILSLQKEKAAIFAAARVGTLFDPTGAAALALATPQVIAANIRAGINLGVIAATAIKPFIKQKFTGGYTEVVGETDGRTYRPQVIGAPSTGLLPNHPVLFQSSATGAPVLASERGREYFVANKDLANPSVANYVRLIDDIVTSNGARVRQFADGGLNTAATNAPAPTPSADAAMMREMANNLALNNKLLNYLISNGVVAVVPDGTVIGINDRLKTLQKVSGNYF
jgi:hypothetical protein